ncbi:ubiquinol-cytochrome c reductase iron-sulfur subunit [Horticoccus luteus]|uniref:Ubiquinol-cytochrome c reductase iron-sulfur subunit n=1 Tax=Horticoccus luteus TaxID=2862869 RepID=A0A8F9TUJ2_9BACT|nr:ubiquinol-cytochrome c reductase iron-sulfur subunit [Horticoccus luteus]QYM78261.1 ubiquinol-cytochrome c reductase iron-sulfur subunit [Horticoccus luteus]
MNETNHNPSTPCEGCAGKDLSRRDFFGRLSLGLAGLCAAILGVPLVGFIFAPLFRKVKESWIAVGKVDDFQVGQTISVPFPDSSPLPWAGITAKSAAWLRRDSSDQFTAFSIHCTHMGCPVRWLAGSKLFMCPCHGGVYYADGTVAAGPPPSPLVRYEVRIASGQVEIKAAPIPITTTL